ncbi:DNA topoisomerase [Marinospirillum insulare]|uniref:DNA topoisomerase n=1 Tax=Marinospirillum insulare TaxID=217169 RepID=A0ABQ5ZWW1_9GAMM|nr:DNA topoisomerase [Marinospirillum insulare]GLR63956.1 DNA topoisomerase III [Marinospirillum insulare]
MTLLIIAESREKGEKIALSIGLTKKGDRHLEGKVGSKNAKLCWASGHIFEPLEPDKVSEANWTDPKSLLPVPKPGRLQPSSRGAALYKLIKGLLKGATEVWLATDADREGEAIGRDILNHAGYKGEIKRLWFSGALEPKDIQVAVKNILENDKTLPFYRAQQARQGADWMWQFLVRGYTIKGRLGLMGSLLGQGSGKESVVSVGRVQTATLKMIVDRDESIKSFRPIDHFTVKALAAQVDWNYVIPKEIEHFDGLEVDDKGKVYLVDKAKVAAFEERLKDSILTITKAEAGKKTSNPPLPHSLTTLQRAMSKQGISPKDTLKLTDEIRLEGYLTYPRTEHGELPISFYNKDDLALQLTAVAAVPALKNAAMAMEKQHPLDTPPKAYTNKPMEHHGIIPTGKVPELSQWSANKVKVFTECSKAFVTALFPSAIYETLDLQANANIEGFVEEKPAVFQRKLQNLVTKGWLELGDRAEDDLDELLPELNLNQECSVTGVKTSKQKTKPAKHFTDDTLLAAMLNAGRHTDDKEAAKILKSVSGIGTPATRATVIEVLQARGYCKIAKAKGAATITATDKGAELINQVPKNLANVAITAKWEGQLNEIDKAPNDKTAVALRDEFLAEQTKFVTTYLKELVEDVGDKKLGGKTFSKTSPPTKKMIDFANSLAKELGLDASEAVKTFDACKAFLNEHSSKKTNSAKSPPTAKMLSFARKLAKERKLEVPSEVESSFESCKNFIDSLLAK